MNTDEMTVEEFNTQYQRLTGMYGDPDNNDSAIAKSNQAFAALFNNSGWTQARIGEQIGKSQTWVNFQLRFARFISYANVVIITTVIISTLTERKFRDLYEKTSKGEEKDRFDKIINILQPKKEEVKPETKPEVKPEEAELAPSAKEKLEAHRRKLDKDFERKEKTLREAAETEFKNRLQREKQIEMQDWLTNVIGPMYQKYIDAYNDIVKFRKEKMPKDKWRLILACLHPDGGASKEKLNEAFVYFKSLEVHLLNNEDAPQPVAFPVPKTAEEWERAKQEMQRKNGGKAA